ncbi:MAG: aromatic ring-hydroxylating dioxygenase subunit alpha [Bacteroidota bacterium]|nr:aromatic ring-hydroxylating dioxygenase subunit alpha [Bacteroidota bacterium]
MLAETELFLKNLWYVAFYGAELKKGKLKPKEILGEKIVFGRDNEGEVFALKDNCPHRGVPLSDGWFDGKCIQCCYHGWEFDTQGVCQNIPALVDEAKININKIKVGSYPCKEQNGVIWVYISNKKGIINNPIEIPDSLLDPAKKFRHMEREIFDANIDHAVIGLVDPAHMTFVHHSWFWRSKKSLHIKEKHFEPHNMGFIMKRHKPSSNSKGYKILKGGTSTQIDFQIPGIRIEHIKVGEKDEIILFSTLTPLNDEKTELNHFFYSSLGIVKILWLPLKKLGKAFTHQDVDIFEKLKRGLQTNPKLMLVGDPDTQARWYYELKKQWNKSQEENVPFVNTLSPQKLKWVT